MQGMRRKKKSDYGRQLEEQQKLKAMYGMISQKQLVLYYKKALRKKENTIYLLLNLLECRLDIAVYRLKLASTIFAAQQLVSHRHILVDGKIVNIRSFQVKPDMTISIKEKSQSIKAIKESLDSPMRTIPEYYSFDEKSFSGKMTTLPIYDQIPILAVDVPLVCEFLAHTT